MPEITDLDKTAARLEGLLDQATKGDWRECRDGACSCGVIWSACGDIHVATVHGADSLGQDWYCSDVAASDDAATSNAALIPAMKNALPALLEERRALRAALQAYVKAYDEGTGTIHANKQIRAALLTANGGEHDSK